MPVPWPARARSWLVLAPIWLVYAAYVVRFWHTNDEAYRTFRYSRDVAVAGFSRAPQGLEGAYESALWMLVAVPLERLGLDVPTAMNLLSLTIGSALLFAIHQALLRHLRLRASIAAAATAVVGLSPAYTVWSTSGLETMAFAALLFATFERLVLARDRMAGPLGGLAALGLALVRPEGLAWAIGVAALAAIGRWMEARETDRPLPRRLHRSPRAVLAPVAVAIAVVVPPSLGWLALRGSWLPTPPPGIAPTLDPASLGRGLAYVVAFGLATLVPPLLLLGARPGLRGHPAHALPAIVLFAAFGVYAVLVGGDELPFGRLLLPALPVGALLGGWYLDDLGARHGRAAALGAALVAVTVGLLPAHDLTVVPRTVRAALSFRADTTRVRTEYQQWEFVARTTRSWREIGEAMAAHSPPEATWATGNAGAKAYYSGLRILDLGTLEDRDASHRMLLERRPTFLRAKIVADEEVAAEVASWRYPRALRQLYLPEAIALDGGRHLVRVRRARRLEDALAGWRSFRADEPNRAAAAERRAAREPRRAGTREARP